MVDGNWYGHFVIGPCWNQLRQKIGIVFGNPETRPAQTKNQ